MYIVLGKNGYIAKSIISELKKRKLHYIALSRKDLDYTNFKVFTEFYHIHYNSHSNPTKNSTIINCAGYIGKPNVDACESNKSDTIMGNVVFPTNLANHCSTNDSTLVQISSGCIYNGYEKKFGCIHKRELSIDKLNGKLTGCDEITKKKDGRPINYSLRFHLYPGLTAVKTMSGNSALIQISKNKSLIDSTAASIILQTFLDSIN